MEESESILLTVKRMVGVSPDDTAFDLELIAYINSAIMSLRQIGVGPSNGFTVIDENDTWYDLLEMDETYLGADVKLYIAYKVKKMFDPGSGSTNAAYDEVIKECEFRLSVEVDPGESLWGLEESNI